MFQSSFITPLENIEAELADIQSYLELPSPSDNPAELTERLSVLMQHMSRSGKLKSDADYHYNKKTGSSIIDALKSTSKLTPSTLNKLVESQCKDEKHLLVWADRINRSCTHSIEGIRSLLSYAKSEMNFR